MRGTHSYSQSPFSIEPRFPSGWVNTERRLNASSGAPRRHMAAVKGFSSVLDPNFALNSHRCLAREFRNLPRTTVPYASLRSTHRIAARVPDTIAFHPLCGYPDISRTMVKVFQRNRGGERKRGRIYQMDRISPEGHVKVHRKALEFQGTLLFGHRRQNFTSEEGKRGRCKLSGMLVDPSEMVWWNQWSLVWLLLQFPWVEIL